MIRVERRFISLFFSCFIDYKLNFNDFYKLPEEFNDCYSENTLRFRPYYLERKSYFNNAIWCKYDYYIDDF